MHSRNRSIQILGLILLMGGFPLQAAAQRAAGPRGLHVRNAVDRERPGAQGGGATVDVDSSRSEMRPLIERYSADRSSLNRYFGLQSIPYEQAPISPAQRTAARLSPAYQARMRQFDGAWLARLKKVDFDTLSQDGRIDYLLLQNHLNHELRQLDLEAREDREEESLLPFAPVILNLEEALRKMEPVDSAAVAKTLDGLAKQIDASRQKLESQIKTSGSGDGKNGVTGIKKSVANRAAITVDGLRSVLKGWFDFYNGYDPLFTWWANQPYTAADRALQNYAAFLREKLVGIKADDKNAIIGDPVGRQALLDDLAYQMIPYTPEELIALAEKEFAWCEDEMKRASREMGYGDDWHKALEAVKEMHVPPGQQPELIRKLMFEAVDFVQQKNLVTVPDLAGETLRMQMMTPERQLVNPFFTGGELMSVSYPVASMTEDQKLMSMRGNNIPFARATAFHEMIPGHRLQLFMAARYRPYRRVFDTPFWVEGWALYWELEFWDLNFARTPAERIGMLFWRMHRCARIIFSLKFHLGEMTPQECIDFLVHRVGHEGDNATAEVRRSFDGSVGPLYQCAYLLGGLQIRALHHELVDSGKMTDLEFHDTLLKENSIPIEMMRADLVHQHLTRDFHSSWRFYDEVPASRTSP